MQEIIDHFSLTSVLGKVMESFIRDHLVNHMTNNTIFREAQHGFVAGRYCMTQLLITLELWTEILDSGVSLDYIYLDFKKAFDSVTSNDYAQTWALME